MPFNIIIDYLFLLVLARLRVFLVRKGLLSIAWSFRSSFLPFLTFWLFQNAPFAYPWGEGGARRAKDKQFSF